MSFKFNSFLYNKGMYIFKILIESFFVGIYSLFLFIIFHLLTGNKLSFFQELFIVGFFKHLLGFYSNIHSYYCNKTCNNNLIIIESLGEGYAFLIMGIFLSFLFDNYNHLTFIYFFIGVFLHLFAELTGIHKFYCNYRCLNLN